MSVAADKRYGFAAQSAWGTAVADGAAFTQLACELTTHELDVKRRENPSSLGTRNPVQSQVTHDVKGSKPAISFSGYARYADLAHFLFAKIQNVTEGATTPYVKTYTFEDTQPAFDSDEGHFLTIIERDPTASRSLKMVDAICEKLTLSLETGDRLKYQADFVGRGVPAHDSNPSGTWTPVDNNFYHYEDLAVVTANWGAGVQNLILKSFEISLPEVATPYGQDSGNFLTFSLSQRLPMLKLAFFKDAQAQSAYANLKADTAIAVRIGWGNATPGTDTGDLDFSIAAKIDKVTQDNDENLLGVELECTIAGASSTADPITVIMADGVDRTF